MTMSLFLIHLGGAAMLLLWAVRMVRTGVERSYGAGLKRVLQQAGQRRLSGVVVGGALAVMLQSSTAVSLLASGFASNGLIAVATGLAVLLGADIGSALVVQILSYKLDWLVPFLIICGAWVFFKGATRTVRQIGRILIGIALILVSLQMMGEATQPLRDSEFLRVVVGYLQRDNLTAFLLGAMFAWIVHSSIAAILLVMTLASQGVVPLEVGIALMLGCNLGAGLIAIGLTRNSEPRAKRIPLGNLLFRALGAIAALWALSVFSPPLDRLGAEPARQIVNLHLIFNCALALICLPFVGPVGRLLTRLLPAGPRDGAAPHTIAERVSALDRGVLPNPGLALASATRELLRISEIVELMLRPVMDLYQSGDKDQIRQVRALDDEVDRAESEIKLYLAELNRAKLGAAEARRSMDLTGFAINLELIGDIISRNLLKLADVKRDSDLVFSREGWRELTDLHQRVLANMQLALNVLVSGDRESARQLVEEKDHMRELEKQTHRKHLERLQNGSVKSIETSNLHLETVRALKEINSLFATVGYGILTESGELLGSRLASAAVAGATPDPAA